ncbi:MAG: nicotinate (nicotinamide) nucleotide adenylyltransferase [Candidatus Delongbacteria bacterium]|nr:nicotinate (nicotinamide) nucleotide adenylyltransferase [Candidatus Delongbacteria bacterium]MBN2835441.1 nicotinate (nicotinamide) nucleotide adenylyltransferase [Candidatus Delongbacteria bacterium]
MQKSKIAIYGGTFDPVHLGHVLPVSSIAELFNFDKVIYVPSYHTPHKENQTITEPFHRIEMLKIALGDFQNFEISSFEIEQGRVVYSYETVDYFYNLYNCDLYFIVGFDSYLKFHTWKYYSSILEKCKIIVLKRGLVKTNQNLNNSDFIFVESEIINISSTEIRKKIKDNFKKIDYIDQKVLQYIKLKGLYL